MDCTVYRQRRAKVMERISKNALVIVAANDLKPRSGDTYYPFRQNNDFYYLSGFDFSGAILVLAPGRESGESILFCHCPTPEEIRWNGALPDIESAQRDYGFDEAFDINQFESMFTALMMERSELYLSFGASRKLSARVSRMIRTAKAKSRRQAIALKNILELDEILHDQMRLIKSPAELQEMQKAVDITVAAHRQAMRAAAPHKKENEIEAEIIRVFMQQGARAPAYTPIVAGGKNACTLHYIKNDEPLQADDLLLIDVGAEYHYYAADITRTFPVSGKFTPSQKALYEIVLEAQLQSIAAIRPGSAFSIVHETTIRVLTQGLLDLGILKGSLDSLIETRAYAAYYMHNTSHWLGMDVHDVGAYFQNGHSKIFEPGMVLTVEPGLYFLPNEKLKDVWWNIGIRIEDDVVVTPEGSRVLSQDLAKTINDIEDWMRHD